MESISKDTEVGPNVKLTSSQFGMTLGAGYVALCALSFYPWWIATRNGGTMSSPFLFALRPTLLGLLPACLIVYLVPILHKWRIIFGPVLATIVPVIYELVAGTKGQASVAFLTLMFALYFVLGLIAFSAEVGLSYWVGRRKANS